ncbi:MAG: class I SAM-dependent methyltransferase [Alphaproteobacteria bacterium]
MSRREWNRTAEKFKDLVCDIAAEETNNQLRLFVSAARPSPDKSVLVDLGCGIGTFVQKFSDRFSRVFAADFATDAIRQAESAYRGTTPTEWHVADLTACPKLFGTDCADLTVCLNVITSPSAARRKSLWETVRTMTKPAGHALIVVPSIESCHMVAERENRGRKQARPASKRDGIAVRGNVWQKHFSRGELVEIFFNLGFSVVRLGAVNYPWSTEGLRKPRTAAQPPWGWICLAKRVVH